MTKETPTRGDEIRNTPSEGSARNARVAERGASNVTETKAYSYPKATKVTSF